MYFANFFFKMVEKADALKKLLDSQGFNYSFSNLKTLGIMAAENKGNLEEALEYLHQLSVFDSVFNQLCVSMNGSGRGGSRIL